MINLVSYLMKFIRNLIWAIGMFSSGTIALILSYQHPWFGKQVQKFAVEALGGTVIDANENRRGSPLLQAEQRVESVARSARTVNSATPKKVDKTAQQILKEYALLVNSGNYQAAWDYLDESFKKRKILDFVTYKTWWKTRRIYIKQVISVYKDRSMVIFEVVWTVSNQSKLTTENMEITMVKTSSKWKIALIRNLPLAKY